MHFSDDHKDWKQWQFFTGPGLESYERFAEALDQKQKEATCQQWGRIE
ncbi:MAG: hypothetical protein HQM13_01705 [SAR324 cluster bacterium]|nr:hypothetical protein [SAR324 cluster bacterium]